MRKVVIMTMSDDAECGESQTQGEPPQSGGGHQGEQTLGESTNEFIHCQAPTIQNSISDY